MTAYTWLVEPFVQYGFMRRALVASVALAVSTCPIGALLVLRRMTLMGHALSHAVLPGAAIGFLIAGSLSLPLMGIGGLVVGLAIVLLSGWISQTTTLKEDTSFATFYLTSLAFGVLIVSLWGSNIDLLHILFGTILAINASALYTVGGIATVTLVGLALIYRPLVVECFDPGFLRVVNGRGGTYHLLFLLLVVVNLVAGFQTLGTLMAVGMMTIPAATAQLWSRTLPAMMTIAAVLGMVSSWIGLLLSYYVNVASGPTIILTASAMFCVSLLVHPAGIATRRRHRATAAG
ncbi:metal ABC transporter permease [Salinisphaera sp. Q1T1-3]|uniref:metal ABC transporter permease n=1 Tax=Salinisphaera sp. Q1T1-3 TaxID=2321229 RepID=UPI000E70DFE6|nr:metal ABC transporter permease [Salinisphaera sp. Q1T1-3]RJS95140.1 metal ABC transporter permease [Salinisphaera sp. Q1T1-3]